MSRTKYTNATFKKKIKSKYFSILLVLYRTTERLPRNKRNYNIYLQIGLLSQDRDKIQCFQTTVLEDFVSLTTQLMSTSDIQFPDIQMSKMADLMPFTVSVLISTEAAEPLKEKMNT